MTERLLGNGGVQDRDRDLERLRERIYELEDALHTANDLLASERDKSKEVAAIKRSHASVKRALDPLFNAMKDVFGELRPGEEFDAEPYRTGGHTPGASPYWENWKRKLAPKEADIIQALLDHGGMTAKQIEIACKLGHASVSTYTSKLKGMALIQKSGAVWSLKTP